MIVNVTLKVLSHLNKNNGGIEFPPTILFFFYEYIIQMMSSK